MKTCKSIRVVLAACAALAAMSCSADAAPEVWLEKATGMEFVRVRKGCFQMGSSQKIPPPADSFWENIEYSASVNEDELPRHEVCLDEYWIARNEVSTDQWGKVMGSPPRALATGVAMSNVSWAQAVEFARRLGQLSASGEKYRLPTEAEWEHACRAGRSSDPPGENPLRESAWFGIREFDMAVPRRVGEKAANAFGLHDMLGNVWEWTADGYRPDAYAHHTLHQPKTPAAGPARTIRGGSVRTETVQVRCAMRGHHDAAQASPLIGFRLVRERR